MTSREMIHLGQRAVRCNGWEWLEGMLAHDPDGQWWRLDRYTVDYFDNTGDVIPVLTDPATLGCLLALVREAWGDPRAYLCDFGGHDSVEWGVVSHEWDEKRQAEGPKAWFACLLGDASTEAGALVRALEAAP